MHPDQTIQPQIPLQQLCTQSSPLGKQLSHPTIINTGALQGYNCFNELLLTDDCMAKHPQTTLFVSCADDPMVVDLITKSDEMAYKEEVRQVQSKQALH